jgi:hypothetical protein
VIQRIRPFGCSGRSIVRLAHSPRLAAWLSTAAIGVKACRLSVLGEASGSAGRLFDQGLVDLGQRLRPDSRDDRLEVQFLASGLELTAADRKAAEAIRARRE